MSDPSIPPKHSLDLEEAAMPFLTLVSSLVVLLLFGVVGVSLYHQLERERSLTSAAPPEEALRQMRQNQENRLSSYGYDEATKSSYMPITDAMDRLAKSKGAKK